MKKIATLILIIIFNVSYSQTTNTNLNNQLQLLRKYSLEKKYKEVLGFTHPEVIKMFGGQEKMIQMTTAQLKKMENDGFSILDITYKEPSNFFKVGKETQVTIRQEILMKSPKGKILGGYTIIGISKDDGKNWKFIDTSGKSKEMMLKYFPNLSPEIVIKPKTKKIID